MRYISITSQVFTGNSDLDTVVLNSLESAVEARYIRFRPKEWHNGIAMRVEVLGLDPIAGKKSINKVDWRGKVRKGSKKMN